jgi:hypothetical protein
VHKVLVKSAVFNILDNKPSKKRFVKALVQSPQKKVLKHNRVSSEY